MTLNPTQEVNNIKRSFNRYIADAVSPATVNYDQDPFQTTDLDSWYSIRYTGQTTEPTGMGDLIGEEDESKGRFRVVNCELSAWCRNDPQRAALGPMADMIVVLCEAASITLYDFADPENPMACGTIYLRPLRGKFAPVWGGGGPMQKGSSDLYTELRLAGFVLEVDLLTISEAQ
jgi:hypothetical protein